MKVIPFVFTDWNSMIYLPCTLLAPLPPGFLLIIIEAAFIRAFVEASFTKDIDLQIKEAHSASQAATTISLTNKEKTPFLSGISQ